MPLGALLVLVLLRGRHLARRAPRVPARRGRATRWSATTTRSSTTRPPTSSRQDYYRKVDRKQLVNKALGSAVESLNDRFSTYFDPKAYKSFEEATEGAFEGVGMNVEEVPRGLRILTVFKGSPAAKGGLEPGDEIIAVNGNPLKGKSSEEATTRDQGPRGHEGHADRRQRARTSRARSSSSARSVDVPVVESKMVRKDGRKVAYVKLASFTSGAHGEVGKAVRGPDRQGRHERRARPARQRRRAPQRGAC